VHRLKRLLPPILLVLFGALAGIAAARTGFAILPEHGFTGGQTAVFIALLPLLYLLCIAIHEGGHVLGGVLAGFRTLLFIVGPLRVERTPDGMRAGLNRNVLLGGGLAGMSPVGLHDLRRRTTIMVAGGPLISIMAGAQILAIFQATSGFLLHPEASFAARLLGTDLLLTGLMSMLIGLITLVPAHSGGFYSDGARMLRLMRTDDDTEREVALLALTGLSLGGTRPRDWDRALVDRGAAIRDGGPFEVNGRQFAYAHALDRGDVEAARTHLEAAMQRLHQLPAAARGSLLLTAATFVALYDGDAARARGLLDAAGSAQGLLSSPHRRPLAEAAVHLADGDVEGARAAAAEARRLAAGATDRGGAALDVALAGLILEES
jgi:hypothetical protein